MKKIFFLGVALIAFSCNNATENTAEKAEEQVVETAENIEEALTGFFGEEIDPSNAISTEEFKSLMAENDSIEVKLAASINECCKKTSCWMTVDLGEGEELLVRFKDYGFFVPKNADGLNAVIQG